MSRLRYVLLAVVVIVLAGMVVPLITRGRVNSDRVGCQNHLRDLGLMGVRHASTPGQPTPIRPRGELPPGTFQNPTLSPDQRMSWYVYTLNVLDQGVPNSAPQAKPRRAGALADVLSRFDPAASWDGETVADLRNHRLTTAICPAQVREFIPGSPVLSNYVALGGIGVDTPARSIEEAGPNAGAYRNDGPTPDSQIKDGLEHTAQIAETNVELGPWLRGGPRNLRGLDLAAEPYLGPGRPFGGCHPGGAYLAMADGSVQFVKDSVNSAVFRSMFTIAGGPEERNFDAP
jgi:prepilin-type processing-associated H-X9-DG protein